MKTSTFCNLSEVSENVHRLQDVAYHIEIK